MSIVLDFVIALAVAVGSFILGGFLGFEDGRFHALNQWGKGYAEGLEVGRREAAALAKAKRKARK